MKHLASCAILASTIFLATTAAEARKPLRVLGCSASDLNGFGASLCVKKGENDILSGSSSVHVAVCANGQVYCCISKNGATSGGRCTNVSSKATPDKEGGKDSVGGPGPKSSGNGCSGGVC